MACSYDEDVCSNEFKLLCGENVRAVNATFPCERPSGSSASTPLGSSLHRHPISTLPLVPGGASRPSPAARECLRQKPAAAEAGVGKDAKKTQKQLEQATR
jgi:hypothetical protein